jgi:hypothetical protein
MEKEALPVTGLARKPSSKPFIEPPPLDTLSSGGDNKTEERAAAERELLREEESDRLVSAAIAFLTV